MKKTLITLLAILGALAAAAALLFIFRDKIKALLEDVKGKFCCNCDEEDFEDTPAEEIFEEAPAEEAPVEVVFEEVPAEEAAAE